MAATVVRMDEGLRGGQVLDPAAVNGANRTLRVQMSRAAKLIC
jgi:hypothetical protein